MSGLVVAGMIVGVLGTLGVQAVKRAIVRRVRKFFKPQVKGRIRNGRKVS